MTNLKDIINSLSNEEREELTRLLEEDYEYIKFDIFVTNSIFKVFTEGLNDLPLQWDETCEVIAYSSEVQALL